MKKPLTKEGGLGINFLAHNFMTPILLCEYNFWAKGKRKKMEKMEIGIKIQ